MSTLRDADPRWVGDAESRQAGADTGRRAPVGVPGVLPAPERRVVEATLRCIARWGVGKTTLDDVAREAGCSRATVYRLFPGGKDTMLQAAVVDEVARFTRGLSDRLDGAASLEEQLVSGMTFAARSIRGHEALAFVLAHEPELVLPHVAFDRCSVLLATVTAAVAPYLRRHLDHERAERAAELVTRLVLSYTLAPSPTVDLTTEAGTERFVQTYVLPALEPTPALSTAS